MLRALRCMLVFAARAGAAVAVELVRSLSPNEDASTPLTASRSYTARSPDELEAFRVARARTRRSWGSCRRRHIGADQE